MQKLRNDIVLAARMIVAEKLDSGPFGNISIRVENTDHFWVNPSGITFDQIMPDDIVLIDIDGQLLEGKHKAHPGAFIHREIYRLRPDINAIVHTHSDHTSFLSLLGVAIEPFTQLGASIYHDQGIYQGFTGPVRDSNEGLDIAKSLGDKSIVIAKNHGLFATAKTIQAALWDMVVADKAAQIHLAAKQLGIHHADKLPEKMMEKSKVEVRDKQCEFMWQSYSHKIKQVFPELMVLS